jgi:hypothetical protein
MRKLARLIGATAAIVLVASAAQAATPVKVVDTPGYEFGSAAGGDWLAWSRSSTLQGDSDLYVKQAGHAARVFDAGFFQEVGNIDLDDPRGDLLVFSVLPKTADAQIRFYDLANRTFSDPPAGINTSKDDERPAISGDSLLFGRGPVGGSFSQRILLYSFLTTNLDVIATAPVGGSVTSNAIRDDYAVYTVCPSNGRCNVFRYQVSTFQKIEMPNPRRATYWPSVLADGTVYFVQGHPTICGMNTRIMRRDPGGTVTKLYQFPVGIEIADLDAVEGPSGPIVYFTRVNCSNGYRSGIWKIKG